MVNLLCKFNELNIRLKFLIASLIPAIILIFMTILPIVTIYKGTEVSILVDAYYSSDSFRGKNLYLRYKFENVDYDKLPASIRDLNKNSNLKKVNAYAVLKKIGDIYDLDYISMEKPTDKLYLKCSILPYYEETPEGRNRITANINCNLDRFFVSEENITPPTMDRFEENADKWLYTAKIKIYKGYGLLTDVKLRSE